VFIHSKTKKCKRCADDIGSSKRSLTIEDIEKTYTDAGCKLITRTDIRTHKRLEFICSCGKTYKKVYSQFKYAPFCKKCGNKQAADKNRYTYEYIKSYFEQHGCKLLSEIYINNNTKLEYICVCGTTSWIPFRQFQAGQRCGCIKSRGENVMRETLDRLGFEFDPQHKYDDCRHVDVLRFDFYVITNDGLIFLIEFDGSQHFEPNVIFGGDARFKNQIKCDNIKNRYAINNGIPMLRISHEEVEHIPLIIDMYVAMLRSNTVPPIIFTNRELYKPMYNAVNDILDVTRIPKTILASDELSDKTKAKQTSSNHYFICMN